MATVDIKIFKHNKKVDGTYNVKIRVTHKRDRRYFDTSHFVSDRQLTTKLTVKDVFLKKLLNSQLDDYRATISGLGEKLEFFTAQSLAEFLRDKNQVIDFIKFSNAHIKSLILDGRLGSAKTLQTVVLSLISHFLKLP